MDKWNFTKQIRCNELSGKSIIATIKNNKKKQKQDKQKQTNRQTSKKKKKSNNCKTK